MKLVTDLSIRQYLGFDDMPDVNNAISIASQLVTSQLESMLESNFSRADREDNFMVHNMMPHMDRDHPTTKVKLRTGFISAGTLVVTAATRYADLASNPVTVATMVANGDSGRWLGELTDLETLYGDATNLGYLNRVNTAGRYIRVAYTSGFEVDGDDPTLYTGMPDWLVQAATSMTMYQLRTHPVIVQAELPFEFEQYQTLSKTILAQHLRYLPSALNPVN
jgi:hypothetical protein